MSYFRIAIAALSDCRSSAPRIARATRANARNTASPR